MNIEGGSAGSDMGAVGTCVDVGSVDRHSLGTAEATSGLVTEFVSLVEMMSERDVVGKSSGAQGTLVDVGEMYLDVEGSLKGVVGPVDAVGAGVAAAKLQKLRLLHALGEREKRGVVGLF
jgi:hypothetical protein